MRDAVDDMGDVEGLDGWVEGGPGEEHDRPEPCPRRRYVHVVQLVDELLLPQGMLDVRYPVADDNRVSFLPLHPRHGVQRIGQLT